MGMVNIYTPRVTPSIIQTVTFWFILPSVKSRKPLPKNAFVSSPLPIPLPRPTDGRGRSPVSGGKDHAGKPRPVVILQDDSFDATDSVTICAFTTDETDAPLFRLAVGPNERNGLRSSCRLMVDKITTVPKSRVGKRIGRLDDEDVLRLNRAVVVFLGLAASPRAGRRG